MSESRSTGHQSNGNNDDQVTNAQPTELGWRSPYIGSKTAELVIWTILLSLSGINGGALFRLYFEVISAFAQDDTIMRDGLVNVRLKGRRR